MADRVVFDRQSAGRIADVVRAVERDPKGGVPTRGRWQGGGIIATSKAVVNSAGGITAASGTGFNTPGTGTALIRRRNPATGLVSTAEQVTVYNDYKTAVPINYRIRICFEEGVWWVATQDCTVGP